MMKIFAYGSNMCTGRLREPARSAQFFKVAKLEGYALRFHKESKDGSGKADAFSTGQSTDAVWGVVFEIDDDDKPKLDRAERGYSECDVELITSDGEHLKSSMYYADAINGNLQPYSWYLRFVVDGARQHGLPEDYITRLAQHEALEDPDHDRDCKQRLIVC